jgi:Protein of unknown function (DUF3134)
MTELYNPSLRQLPRHEAAEVIPLSQETSILDWLQSTGRLIPREDDDQIYVDDEEEIDELMGGDDSGYDDELDEVDELE